MTTSYDQFFGEWDLLIIHTSPKHPFTDASGFAFTLWRDGDWKSAIVYEDPDDGYRSSAEDPLLYPSPIENGISVRIPVSISALTDSVYTCDGLQMQDRRNGKIILRLGTENTNDYYPWFCAEWTPENIEGGIEE